MRIRGGHGEAFRMANDVVKHDGLVAKILDKKSCAQQGITQWDLEWRQFRRVQSREEIHDPKTGGSLGILEEIKGKGEVIHVQDHICTIQTYEFDLVPVPREQNPYPPPMSPPP